MENTCSSSIFWQDALTIPKYNLELNYFHHFSILTKLASVKHTENEFGGKCGRDDHEVLESSFHDNKAQKDLLSFNGNHGKPLKRKT